MSGNTWSTVAPPRLASLLAGASATFSVTVTVPSTATGGQTDIAVVTLRSRGNPTKSADVELTTTAERRRVYLPIVRLSADGHIFVARDIQQEHQSSPIPRFCAGAYSKIPRISGSSTG